MPAEPWLDTFDACAEAERLAAALKKVVGRKLRRRGAIVAVSGGIDSAVTAALACRALGPERVFLLLLPERDSSPEAMARGRLLAKHLGAPFLLQDITPILEAAGAYAAQAAAIRRVFPEYGPGWRTKLVIAGGLLERERLNYFKLVACDPAGRTWEKRLPARAYLELVAATNFKQRVRKMLEYYHADRLHYAVLGTPNRLEYELGFFVKLGDGAADVKPIAHLLKGQVYALAEALGLPEAIRKAPPTTDTFSLPQSQEEFFFAAPLRLLDGAFYARDRGYGPAEAAALLGITPAQTERLFRDIDRKRETTRYLHLPPLLLTPEPTPAAALAEGTTRCVKTS